MPRSRRRSGVGATAAAGLIVDSEIRSAAIRAAPPVARLAFAIAKRTARLRARQLGFVKHPARGRRLALPAAAGTALAGATVYLADPERRRKAQRLVVR